MPVMEVKKYLKPENYIDKAFGMLRGRLKLVLKRVETTRKAVALTFDDGPHPVYTPELLELLDRYQARATFFFVGESAEKYPHIVKRAAASGHAIGNHSWSHPPMPCINRKERLKQIARTKKVLQPYGQKLFRPPWGFLTFSSYLDVSSLGYTPVYWDVAANDWCDLSADELFNRLDTKIRPGSIVLMHDTLYVPSETEQVPRETLFQVLDEYLQKHQNRYNFVSVPELLRLGRPVYEFGIKRKKDAGRLLPDEQKILSLL